MFESLETKWGCEEHQNVACLKLRAQGSVSNHYTDDRYEQINLWGWFEPKT